MHVITAAQLVKAAPKCPNPDGWVGALNNAMLLYGVSDSLDVMAAFLGHCAHESQQFTRLEENLNYTAERLCVVWPKHFPSITVSAAYARAPHKLADFIYADRLGNGDIASGDGWRFRGRGLLMLTGRSQYRIMSAQLNDSEIMRCPDRLLIKNVAALSAAAWWSNRPELSAYACTGDVRAQTQMINGGLNGFVERCDSIAAFSAVLT